MKIRVKYTQEDSMQNFFNNKIVMVAFDIDDDDEKLSNSYLDA